MALPEPWLCAEAIETPRLRLDSLTPEDAEAMHPVLDDQRLHEYSGGQPLALEELRTWYQFLARGLSPDGQEVWLNWIVRLDGEAIGYLQAGVDEMLIAQVAWVIGVAWQGNGYGSESAAAMVEWLLANKVEAVIAAIHPGHEASAGVARRCGLVLTEHVVDGERIWRRDA
ncbi:MAG: GNAT family N-acetyltransferase [Dehalococcoidia bacterium]|nr:GNAT family N-acetyltransferase [Dehalococcoidia bacterium]